MPRPVKCRRVAFLPGVNYFKPAGIPLRVLDEICLSIEEVEAIRLKDVEDLDQAQCAEKMNVSRPTFQRVLESSRKKVADALLNGKAIKIEGGNFETAMQRLCCTQGHHWSISLEEITGDVPEFCPQCSSRVITSLPARQRCCSGV